MELNEPMEIDVINLTYKKQTTSGMSHNLERMDIVEMINYHVCKPHDINQVQN